MRELELNGLHLLIEVETAQRVVGDESRESYISPNRIYVTDDTDKKYLLGEDYVKENIERIIELLNEE